MGPGVTCQRRFRRFLALFLRVVVSLIRFHNRPGESFLFTTSSARVAQNAPAPPNSAPPAIGESVGCLFFLLNSSAAEDVRPFRARFAFWTSRSDGPIAGQTGRPEAWFYFGPAQARPGTI